MSNQQAEHRSQKQAPLSSINLYIMKSLLAGERHPYRVVLDLRQELGDTVTVGTTTVYRAISKMEEDGLIEATEERPDPALDDTRRTYYRLTEHGRQVLKAEGYRLFSILETLRQYDLLDDLQDKRTISDEEHSDKVPDANPRSKVQRHRWLSIKCSKNNLRRRRRSNVLAKSNSLRRNSSE